jgi:hypothetical protein
MIHGFQVQSYGQRLSPGVKRGLRRLAERDFLDPACVVVKTASGNRSGVTHAGGRYVPPEHLECAKLMREMRNLGIEPPPPPFVVAPGEFILYHEWGHHVDRTWSGADLDVRFSFRWFSQFYRLGVRHSHIGQPGRRSHTDEGDLRPIASHSDAANAVLGWWLASSELFANLFEDWMRGNKRVAWDECEPEGLTRYVPGADCSVRIALLPEARVEEVRVETQRLFTSGIRRAVDLPPVHPGLFGKDTDEIVERLRIVRSQFRTEPQ